MRSLIAWVVGLVIACVAVQSTLAESAWSSYVHTARVDLDGDGRRDRISLARVKVRSETERYRYRLAINRSAVEGQEFGVIYGFRIARIRKGSAERQVEVGIGDQGSDWIQSDIYAFKGGRIRRLNDHLLMSVQVPGDGTVRTTSSWNGFWGAEGIYRLDRSGKLVAIKRQWHRLDIRATVDKALTLYAEPKSSQVKAVLPRGRWVRLEIGDESGSWYRVRSSGGSRGWMRGDDVNPCLGIPMAG